MLRRRLSPRDRREVVVTTTALRRGVSTFAMPVRTLDPARGPLLRRRSRHHAGNRGRDLCRRSVTMGTSASGATAAAAWRTPPDDDRFTCVTGSGLRIFC